MKISIFFRKQKASILAASLLGLASSIVIYFNSCTDKDAPNESIVEGLVDAGGPPTGQKITKVRAFTADEIYQQKMYYLRNKIVVAEYKLERLIKAEKYGAKLVTPLEQIELSEQFEAQTDRRHLPADFQEYTKRCNELRDLLEEKIKRLPHGREPDSLLAEFYFEHLEPLREEFRDAALFFEGSSKISKALEDQLSDEVTKLCRQDPQPNLSRIESDIIEAKYTLRVLQSLLKDLERNDKQ